MNLYLFVKYLHILAAIMLTGGLFARQLVRQHAKKSKDIHQLASLLQAAGLIENIMVIPGNLAVILLGVLLALMAGYPIFGFLQGASQNWLLVSNILLVIMLILIPTVLVPRGKKFESIIQSALLVGQITPDLRTALDDNVVKLVHLYEEISIIIVVALMVLKPF